MNMIAHRINTIEELKKIPKEYGVEIDLRDNGDDLILEHDPFSTGERFEDFLAHYQHGTLILNIKSERIEHRVLELIQTHQIHDYFFLDSSFPMIHLLTKQGEKNVAIRFSEYEGLDTILQMKGKAKWVWVDCFSQLPLTQESYRILKDAGFSLCLVSPELQGRPEDILPYKTFLEKEGFQMDAVCTKIYHMDLWQS